MKKQGEFRGKLLKKPKDAFGGSQLKSNPKVSRPLDSKLPIHLVLKARKGGMRKPKHFKAVNDLVYGICKQHCVRLYEYANVGNHLHLLIKLPSRNRWSGFIRALTGRIAQHMSGLEPNEKAPAKFWKFRPFTRVVAGWQRAYRIAKEYVFLNHLEAEGFIDRRQTKNLNDLHAIWGDG